MNELEYKKVDVEKNGFTKPCLCSCCDYIN